MTNEISMRNFVFATIVMLLLMMTTTTLGFMLTMTSERNNLKLRPQLGGKPKQLPPYVGGAGRRVVVATLLQQRQQQENDREEENKQGIVMPSETAKFGDVVSIRDRPNKWVTPMVATTSNNNATSAGLLASQAAVAAADDGINTDDSSLDSDSASMLLDQQKRRNFVAATVAVCLSTFQYGWKYTHPITPIQLLVEMQSSSTSMTNIGANGKPSIVEFWAPWCEQCLLAAPTMYELENEYNDRINFCMVNGDDVRRRGYETYLTTFRVDAIPHLSLVSHDGIIETTFVGPIPKKVLAADLEAMIRNAERIGNSIGRQSQQEDELLQEELPYKMVDLFSGRPRQERRVGFEE